MADPTPPTPSLLRRTATDRRRLLTLADGRPVLAAAIPLIRRIADRLGRDNALFFARPSLARDAGGTVRSITWYGPSGERPVRFSSLDGRSRAGVEAALSARLEALAPLLDDPALGPLLSTALVVPALDDVLVLGTLPVLTGWGTVPSEVSGADGIAAHFDRTLGAFAPFGLSIAALNQAMGTEIPATDDFDGAPADPTELPPPDRAPHAPSTTAAAAATAIDRQGAPTVERGDDRPSTAEGPPAVTEEAGRPPVSKNAPRSESKTRDKAAKQTSPTPPTPAADPATVGAPPPGREAPAADAKPSPPPRRRLPASVIAAGVMALLLGLSFVPGVVETRAVPGAGPGDEALAMVQAINATLARNIAAADSLTATVCEAEPTPALDAERGRLLLTDPARLTVPVGGDSLETRLRAQTLRLETVPTLEGARADPLGTLTLIGPTTAIGPDIGRRPGEVTARAGDRPLAVTAVQPLPEGLALFELAEAAPEATEVAMTTVPVWRSPVMVGFAPPIDSLPDVILAAGAVANGAPGAPVPDAVGLVHTAPVAEAVGGGVFDLCGRLIAVARPLDGAAVPVTRLTRALSAAGSAVSVSDQPCQPSRRAGPAAETGSAG